MAIQFARIEHVQRSAGKNACCKGAYNARGIVKDMNTGVVYNFQDRDDNVYHEILLPEGVDEKFKNVEELMNEVEQAEKRKDSVLLKDIVLALPDDKELNLEDRIEITKRLIEKREWIKERLGVQVDIHKPHDGEKNWHAHLLVTTRRFTEDGKKLSAKKAIDLEPKIVGGKARIVIKEDQQIHEDLKEIINDYFRELGLENRVDPIGIIRQEHIGPVRMRSILNEAVIRNEERRLLNIEMLKSGRDVLERVTKEASIFSKSDLERAVKIIPDRAKREVLVEEALASKEIVALYHENGEESGLYTTKSVRNEELKLARLSGYIGKQKNVVINSSRSAAGMVKATIKANNLSEQRGAALSHLLLGEGGVRILKGRAGTGKSTVLGRLVRICRDSRIEVVGLAPTRKAVLELEAVGYKKSDTIKGFLFKLYNDRADLGNKSLIVIDEAGMVGNEDYAEVMRVAAAKNCNVILSGDERQLASVGRGRMFEYFAERFGYAEMNEIRRQKAEWGREVSRAFSEGRVREGLEVLKEQGRLCFAANRVESMASLLEDWSKSSENISNRLIITVKNSDVDSLNEGARSILKSMEVLSGVETVITRTIGKDASGNKITVDSGFMAGERIVFTESDKKLGVNNGDFGMVVSCSSKEFVVLLGEGGKDVREVVFNPVEFSSLKHGYASTVYKAQGASIKDVYVLHGGFSTSRNSYVAMSRHVNDLRFYADKKSSSNFEKLVKQLSYNSEKSNSIGYYTKEDLQAGKIVGATREMSAEEINEERGLLARVYGKVKEQVGIFVDKYNVNNKYYRFEKPVATRVEVEEILELINEYRGEYREGYKAAEYGGGEVILAAADKDAVPERIAVAGGQGRYGTGINPAALNLGKSLAIRVADSAGLYGSKTAKATGSGFRGEPVTKTEAGTAGTRMTAKERFYAAVEYRRKIAGTADFDLEAQKLRQEVRWSAERVARNLLGEPNRRLSNGSTLRFGKNGSMAVSISGEKCGSWYDFSESRGGDLFDLVQEKHGCDFKGAVSCLEEMLGVKNNRTNLQLVYDADANHKYTDHTKQLNRTKAEEAAKARKTEKLYGRSREVGTNSIAYRYLSETRNITCEPGADIRTAGIYEREAGKYLPALIAFARNSEGVITGGQQLLLAGRSGNKAQVTAPRRSFGRIAGSFVSVMNEGQEEFKDGRTDKTGKEERSGADSITVIAEGLETALSVKAAFSGREEEAGLRIICALGISNIKNYTPKEGEKIIIAADNDGEGAATDRTIQEAYEILSERAVVRMVKPKERGDFNDILQKAGKEAGAAEIRDIFRPAINNLTTKTLEGFLASASEDMKAGKPEETVKSDMAYIVRYGIDEEKITESFRQDYRKGAKELSAIREKIEAAEKTLEDSGKNIAEEIKLWNSRLDNYNKGNSGDITDAGYDNTELIKALFDIKPEEHVKYLMQERDRVLGEYLSVNLDGFEKAGRYVNSPEELFEVTKKEQAFLLETGRSMKDDINKYEVCNMNALHAAVAIAENPELSARAQSRAEEALTEGVLSRGEVLYMFRRELNPDKILQTLDKRFEEHHINTALSSFRQEKLEADNIKDFLKAAGREQEFLKQLQGTLKYTAEDKTLQKAIYNAVLEHKEGIIEKLAEAGKYCLANGIKTEREIIRELDATIDAGIKAGNIREAEGAAKTGKEKERTTLRGVYVKLDRICEKHSIETFLKSSESAKKEAGTLKDMLKAIAAEQEYLANLHGNLKYPDSCHEDIRYLARRAAEWRKEGIVPKLAEIAGKCISSGAGDENTIVSELKILDHAEASYNILNVKYGVHHVIENSEVFRQEKRQAKTLDDMLKIITREQDFLAGLHNNKEYSDGYTKKTADIIKAAHEGQQNNIMDNLRKITEHITGHKVMPEKELLDRLADDTAVTKRGIGVIINELSGFARDHYSGTVNRNMVAIAEKGHIEVHGKKFDCAVKYLKHEIAHPAHEYADIARFKKSLPQVQEKVQQMQPQPKLEMSKKQEKVYDMGGRSM